MATPSQTRHDASPNLPLPACGKRAGVGGVPQAQAHPIRIPKLRVANTFLSRFLGLMLRGPLARDEGLLITHCHSVHTAWLRYPIDLVYLNREGMVLRCVPHLKPWRTSFGPRGTAHTLELPAGNIEHFDLRRGNRIDHPCLSPWRSP